MKETRGFVYTVSKGERTYHPALRTMRGVARYRKNGDGIWCGPRVAATFFEHTWENVDRERLAARIKWIEELDRLMPVRSVWGNRNESFDCKMCGAVVHNRNTHWKFHFGYEQMLSETVTALFGGE